MRRIAVAVLALLCCPHAHADIGTRVDQIAKDALTHHVAGVSIAVARDGQVVLARGYGVANVSQAAPVTPETVFHIDSVSKFIAAAVVLQLADKGRVRLDDDIRKYLPEAPTQERRVTVAQLLTHTSGIFSFTSLPDAAENERRDLTHKQVLALIKDRPFDFEPGTSWRYDNSGFYLAGMIIERVTGTDYGSYLREAVFNPLGMNASSLCDARAVVPHMANGYDVDRDKLVNALPSTWTLPFAGGGVCSTATDLLKWQAALDSGRVLSRESLALMRKPVTLADGTRIDYGMGTRLGSLDGHRVLGHTGSGGGFNAVLESFPDDHLTIAVLVNTDNGQALPIATAIARAALELPQVPARDLPLRANEAAMFAGRYESDEGTVEVFGCGDRLCFRPEGKAGDGIPLHRRSDTIFAIDDDSEVRFLLRDGHATWGSLYVGGLMLDAKRSLR